MSSQSTIHTFHLRFLLGPFTSCLSSACLAQALATDMGSDAPRDLDFGKPDKYDSSSDDNRDVRQQHIEDGPDRRASVASRKASVAAKLRNPLTGMSEEDCIADVDQWCEEKGLSEHQAVFRKGALLARVNQRSDGFEYLDAISEEEKAALREEVEKRWSQPFMLYFLVVLCAGSAIVQGMDQTAVNGAQVGHYVPKIPRHQGRSLIPGIAILLP